MWVILIPVTVFLQCMVDSGAWQRVNTQVPIRSPRYAVFDLAEGKQYKFRVLSANMYGTSEASEPTGPIETQALKGKGQHFFTGKSEVVIETTADIVVMIIIIYCTVLIFLFRCTICSWSGNFNKGNRHFCPHPVGSTEGTQQSDWLLHWPVCEGVQGLDLSQSQTSQRNQVCFKPISLRVFFVTIPYTLIVFLQVCG